MNDVYVSLCMCVTVEIFVEVSPFPKTKCAFSYCLCTYVICRITVGLHTVMQAQRHPSL